MLIPVKWVMTTNFDVIVIGGGLAAWRAASHRPRAEDPQSCSKHTTRWKGAHDGA
jgi:succinate dehydrogenase/fumarate reductase flavoprotein subunit